MLVRSWSFRVATAAFLVLIIPALDFYLRGQAGFLVLISLTFLVTLVEKTFAPSLRMMMKGMAQNRLFSILSFWYIVGLIFNSLLRGRGVDDWRLILAPAGIFFAMWFAFSFLRDPACFRQFQIIVVICLGLQNAYATLQFLASAGMARLTWSEVIQTGSVLGNQTYFAMFTVLLPIMLWRALKESGRLRWVLLASCFTTFTSVVVSSFATPVGLVIAAVLLYLGLSLMFMFRARTLLIVVVLTITAGLTFFFTYQNPIFNDAYSRIVNFVNDPTSGGYLRPTDNSSRWYLGLRSLDSFFSEPFFGPGGGNTRYNPNVGGHSSLFDSLGAYGLFGGGGALVGLMLLMLFRAFAVFLRERNSENLMTLIGVILLFIGGVVNPYWEAFQPTCIVLMTRFFMAGSLRKAQIAPLAPSAPRAPAQTGYAAGG